MSREKILLNSNGKHIFGHDGEYTLKMLIDMLKSHPEAEEREEFVRLYGESPLQNLSDSVTIARDTRESQPLRF